MAVNGIEIEVGQVWRTRGGREAQVKGFYKNSIYPWRGFVATEDTPVAWAEDGQMCLGFNHIHDIVGLVNPAPAKERPVQFIDPAKEAAFLAAKELPGQFAEQSANATQVGGDHYKTQVIQPWDFIASNGIGFLAGNVVKYVARYKAKNGMEDLKKARHYLDKLIETEGGAA